jgi:hypothetical protein
MALMCTREPSPRACQSPRLRFDSASADPSADFPSRQDPRHTPGFLLHPPPMCTGLKPHPPRPSSSRLDSLQRPARSQGGPPGPATRAAGADREKAANAAGCEGSRPAVAGGGVTSAGWKVPG